MTSMPAFMNPAQLNHGPALIGIFLNILLYGIMLAQCFLYFLKFRHRDNIWLKAYVLLLLLADTFNSVFDMYWIYDILVGHFHDASALETVNWVFASSPAFVGIIAAMVQFFFAYRVKVLSRNKWLFAFIVVTAMGSLFGGVGTAIALRYVPRFTEFQQFSVIVIVWLFSATICDVVITVAVTYHLRKYQSGFNPGTDDALDRIIRVTVQNGLLTTVCSIIDLALFLALPTGLHLVFNFPLAKLYTNSALSTLNARAAGPGEIAADSIFNTAPIRNSCRSIPPKYVSSCATTSTPTRTSGTPKTEVFVDVETHETVDRKEQV